MKVAIYARYSSENQRQESIEDQVRVCKEFAKRYDYTVLEEHIYWDEAKSGAIRNRPALDKLLKACEQKELQAILIDDLSRLSRNNHHLLTLCAQFQYWEVELISVADGLNTKEEHAKLGIQMRGIINELYLDDLRKKTHRGQMGQKLRGFVVGEKAYGYQTKPFGEMKVDSKGKMRPDGYKAAIDSEEAIIVKRIFEQFADGMAITEIVKRLNGDKIPTSRRMRGGWNVSSVSKKLKNERYIGKWVWNKSRAVRDPLTGKKRKIQRPESEWIVQQDENLRIISKELWQKTKYRWKGIEATWPTRTHKKGFQIQQKSYVKTHPPHLLAGATKCGLCGGAIVQISGKGAGYYGCFNAKRKTCENRLNIPRKRLEEAVLKEIREKLLVSDKIHDVLKKVEQELKNQQSHLPEEIKFKQAALDKLQSKIQNFIHFVAEGKGSKAIAGALTEAESEEEKLKKEVEALEYGRQEMFQTPPKEWIQHRLAHLQEALEKKTNESALLLRRLLGPITLTPIKPDIGKSFYRVHTKLNTVSILPPETKSANSLQWRRG